jgi:integral membrane sensor domain MASE1
MSANKGRRSIDPPPAPAEAGVDMTAEHLTMYLLAAAFACLGMHNGILAYQLRATVWKRALAAVSAAVFFVMAYRAWPGSLIASSQGLVPLAFDGALR